MERWKEVDEYMLAELRRMTVEQKLAQLVSLAAASRLFRFPESKDEEDARVVALWNLLRERLGP